MKKLLWLIAMFSMLIPLVSCGGSKNNENTECTECVDSNNDGICDKCSKPVTPDNGGNSGGENTAGNGDEIPGMVNITKLGYTVVWDKSAEKKLAEDFIDELMDKTGVLLDLKKNEDAEYKILFGRVTDFTECDTAYKNLSNYVTGPTSAYSVIYKENTVVVTATNNDALKYASDKLLSYVNDGKLLIPETLNDSYIAVPYTDETKFISFSEFEATTLLTSIKANGKNVSGLKSDVTSYSAKYPSTDIYPTISANSVNPLAQLTITQAEDNNGKAEISVASADAENNAVYTIDFMYEDAVEIKSEIVNKDALDGVVTFVFDDGDKHTADILVTNLLPKYEDIRLSFGIITKELATVESDGRGGFNITPKAYSNREGLLGNSYFAAKNYSATTSYNYDFWNDVLNFREGIEILSHGQFHDKFETSDDFDSLRDEPELEILGSKNVIKELLGIDSNAYVLPYGDGPITNSSSHREYYELLQDEYIGARGTQNQVVTYEWFKTAENRFQVPAHAVRWYGSNNASLTTADSSFEDCIAAGIDNWTDHIDNAVKEGGWAGFCLHTIAQDNEKPGGWDIYESQADALFAYAQKLSDEGKIWIATYTEAQIYYNEWSTADVKTVLKGDTEVNVSITDKEADNEIYNMPLTVKVSVPRSWTTANFSYNGNSGALDVHESNDGAKYVYVNVIPDVGTLTITK